MMGSIGAEQGGGGDPAYAMLMFKAALECDWVIILLDCRECKACPEGVQGGRISPNPLPIKRRRGIFGWC